MYPVTSLFYKLIIQSIISILDEITSTSLSSRKSISKFWKLNDIRKKWNGNGTVIAILDTNIDWTFLALNADKKCIVEHNLKDLPSVSMEHGTVCAAVAAGRSYSISLTHKYPSGVAPEANFVAYCVARDNNNYSSKAIIASLQHILQNLKDRPVDVVSMSLSFNGNETDISDILAQLSKAGVILVAAAGNDGKHHAELEMPARDKHVISVGSLDENGEELPSCPPNGLVDVLAPGVYSLALSLQDIKGTSIAAAAVAGLVSLLIQCVKESFPGEPALIKRLSEPKVLRLIFNHHMIKCITQKDGKTVDRVLDPKGFFERVSENKALLRNIL